MTTINVLDHGFVRLVDHMGDDSAIVQAARVSYGEGTKTPSEDRGLIRYLMRHQHWTPFEMVELKFHVKLPIFVERQWVRHRTASTNEESARYSVMSDGVYTPSLRDIKPQSTTLKQGTADEPVSVQDAVEVRSHMLNAYVTARTVYESLLKGESLVCEKFTGISREQARIVMPLASYTQKYWKTNLRNLIHFLHLRLDKHAQYEIRVYAEAIKSLVAPLFPLAIEAADDYVFGSYTLSRMDIEFLRDVFYLPLTNEREIFGAFADHKRFGMTKREADDLMKILKPKEEQ